MNAQTQQEPCPHCGQTAGWWSGINGTQSMVFHAPNGEITTRRVYEKKRKHCVACDAEITKIIK